MVILHHQLSGHELEKTIGDSGDQEAWHTAVHGVAQSQTRLRNCTVTMNKMRSWVGSPDESNTLIRRGKDTWLAPSLSYEDAPRKKLSAGPHQGPSMLAP